ncbi:MAG: sugar phosphate nucleotidyltransferase [candidate division KSB1 bacterium]|nr:sugar phosphate nucleotidyltransferase [candidate division KSB1 bacterium]MDZ7293958.1 sugar phosphate nucleotidyltransferase [candidate division KSB1 bacterium]MDZ7339088.1 sugar phosphate nucleotidyltransferase [candidate division KSB1 bacterium]MDZ7385057.1 sugar phosphate nucleotidyltransferase [candidate division KSB1 bacterium]MDZ7392595.1 sugar phosphate nucleotidyltransferase [candidate division KSB1 bacterium]
MKRKDERLAAVILAAGKGKRMKSDLAKVLHQVLGRPMVMYVIDQARAVGAEPIIVVVGHQRERVMETLRHTGVLFAVQEEQLGTAHAVAQAEPLLKDFDGEVLVLCGDVPLLSPARIEELIAVHRQTDAVATLLVGRTENPFGYGRIIRDPQGFVDRIVEEKDATPEEKAIQEVNIGTYVFDAKELFATIPLVSNDNAQGEYYLPDVVKIMRRRGERVAAVVTPDFDESMGVNSVEQLHEVERVLLARQQGEKSG